MLPLLLLHGGDTRLVFVFAAVVTVMMLMVPLLDSEREREGEKGDQIRTGVV